jgi:hypothetical protein
MPDDVEQGDGDGEEYARLAELEDLESLLEEMEEQGVVSLDQPASVPADLREHMQIYGVRDVQQLRDRIMHLHAEIDEDEDDLTISDS